MSSVMPGSPRITLLTDFGTADGYVGAMKGVIATLLPTAIIDDITHDIPPGDVPAAAWCLSAYWREYPVGTVHVCVVDPGVGSERRPVIVHAADRVLVGPDNGLFTNVFDVADCAVHHITDAAFMRTDVSATFHGRDLFAVAAARIAAGAALTDAGPVVVDPVRVNVPEARHEGTAVRGVVCHVDRFGNAITNIPGAAVPEGARVVVEAFHGQVPLVRTYSDAAAGRLIALIGSSGFLEIALRDGSAAERLGKGRGLRVTVMPG